MELIRLTESIIEYILISSTLLFILGLLSLISIQSLKVQGRAKLWVCSLIIILPLTYPLQTLLPESVRVPVRLEMNYFQRYKEIDAEKTVSTNKPFISDNIEAAVKSRMNETISEGGKALTPGIKDVFMSAISTLIANWKLVLSIVWGGVFSFFLFRIVTTGYITSRFLRIAVPVTNPEILKLFNRCVSETGMRHTPQLFMVEGIKTPMAMGFFKPKIVIPLHLLKSKFKEGLQFTLLHELKHLQQRHNWWLLIESIIGSAYFFHPVFHWAKGKIHEELENICDRHVTNVTDKSVSYADFLLNQIWQQSSGRNPVLALPFISNASITTTRIHSILEKARPTSFTHIRDRLSVYFVLMIFSSILLLSFAPNVPPSDQLLNNLNTLKMDRHESANNKNGLGNIEKEVSFIEDSSINSFSEVSSHIEKKPVLEVPDGTTESPAQIIRDETAQPVLKSRSLLAEMNNEEYKAKTVEKSPAIDTIEAIQGLNILGSVTGTNILWAQSAPAAGNSSDKSLSPATLAERYLGIPVSALSLERIYNIKVLDEFTVLFIMRGRDIYLTRLSVPCPDLLYASEFNFLSNTGKISKYDRIQAISNGQIMGTTGMLGPIYPYKYEGNKYEAMKLLKKSLLTELVNEGAFKES